MLDRRRRCRRPARGVPAASAIAPGDADHAGDAELAGDDRGVAGRAAPLGDQREHDAPGRAPAVSAGARSSATSTDGRVGHRDARLGLAHQVGDHAALDVAQVGDPLGHQAAHAGEHRDELLDAPRAPRRAGRRPPRRCLRTAARSPLSRASPALAVSTSAAAPERLGGPARRSPSATAAAASSYAASAASASATPRRRSARSPSGDTSPRTTEGGRVGDAGDDRGAVQGDGWPATMRSWSTRCHARP